MREAWASRDGDRESPCTTWRVFRQCRHGGAESLRSVGGAGHGGARFEMDVESGIPVLHPAAVGPRPDNLGVSLLAGEHMESCAPLRTPFAGPELCQS